MAPNDVSAHERFEITSTLIFQFNGKFEFNLQQISKGQEFWIYELHLEAPPFGKLMETFTFLAYLLKCVESAKPCVCSTLPISFNILFVNNRL